MNKPQKPMMLAYIIFLLVCILYYPISYIFGFEFAVGNRIVAAATIASYCFTLSSLDKLNMKQETINAEFFKKELQMLKKIRDKEQKQQDLRVSIDAWIKELTETTENAQKAISKHERKAFWNDVLGFLLFFCIVAFDLFYALFANTQEVYTLGAFTGVVAIEYLESIKMVHYEEKRRNTAESIQNIYTRLEELDNG